jgi:TPR repeat protein
LELKNYERAHQLFEKASDLGSGMAMYDLGVIYLHGLGFAKDGGVEEDMQWLHSASTSDGFAKDDAQALRLFEQAVSEN